jgi:hypothetical protein
MSVTGADLLVCPLGLRHSHFAQLRLSNRLELAQDVLSREDRFQLYVVEWLA